jgi:PKD repeat protein
MQPTQFNYPEFVPDQILTSSNLNDMFNYLDEQDRLTRTNLIGVGIVCGLEVSINASYTQLTISAGCGITSGGYLITFPKTTFTQYNDYNALKPLYYEKFVDGVSKTQRYKLAQLFETAVVEGATPLSKDYLKDKVVMLYVELLEDQAKNCDPGSCDDKGKNIDISFRPLLISIDDAAKLKTAGADYGDSGTAYKTLPKLKMPRYNVPATLLQSTAQVLDVYRKILSTSFIDNVQNALTQTYNILQPVIKDIYPTNPFAQLSSNMAFLNNGSLTELEAINYQYYYDLFSDVELAYSELRETGIEALSLCCPDANLFRLHLLLGNVIPDNANPPLVNRQYFIPSPVMECHCKQTNRLRWLFKRIQLLLQNFYAAYGVTGNFGDLYTPEQLKARQLNNNIRITPSSLGKYPLAKKAIPFYYMPVEGTGSLVDNWDIEKTADGEADQNLSYNSNLYATDDYVLNPLNYDLEPYNFLRVEGHIGMNYTTALKSIVGLRNKNRLPFDVVALGTDLESLKTALADLGKTSTVAALVEKYADRIKTPCQFQDIDTLYDTLIAEITCQLCRTMLYFYQLNEPGTTGDTLLSKVPLVLKCNPGYYVQPATFGFFFEKFYANYKKDGIAFMYRSFDKQGFTPINIYFFFLLYIEQFFETFTSSLGNFDFAAFTEAYKRMISIATDIKDTLSNQTENDSVSLETLEQLKKLIGMCVQKPIEALYKDYLLRWVHIMMLQKFGYFARKHPGIQHKAGVPMGGTFVMVYHETPVPDPTTTNAATLANAAREQAADAVLAKANQSPQEVLKLFGLAAPNIQQPPAAPQAGAQINMEEATGGKVIADAPKFQGGFEINAPEYTGPASHFDDINAFKTENQAELDELGILLQGINATQSPLADAVAEIGNGIVIADFYLPYMCCSDCPPIQFTVNEVAEPLTIAVPPGVFCGADDKTYDIKVTPDGGEITGEGTSKTAEGKFVFTPSVITFAAADKARDITLTYKAFGQSITTKVTVYQKPVADFDAVPIEGETTVTITNKSSAFADKYSWDFGDNQASLDKDPAPHNYTSDGTFTITLSISNNNICNDKISKEVTINTPDVTISMSKSVFCSNDDTPYQISVAPDGATVDGEGAVDQGGGNFVFTANKVAMNGAASKKITLTAHKGTKSKQLDITVYQQPTADFAIVPQTDKPGTVAFINKSPAYVTGYQWTFGDLTPASTDATPPPHTYTTEGDYPITLEVYNSDCKGIPKTINYNVQLPKPEIDIVPKLFCIQDTKPYPISVGADGGTVTGDGVNQLADGSYIFTPSSVPVFPTAKRPVIFTNTLNGVPKTVEVTLYSAPIVKFSTAPVSTSPFSVQFINETENADKFQWIFDTQGTSDERDPIKTFSLAGTINVTLRASNADMCKGFITQPVTIVGQQLITKTCLPVAGILEQFNGLKEIDTKNYSAFVRAFPVLTTELKPFFESLNGADGLSMEDQVALFKKRKATDLIPKWIDMLTKLLEKNIALAGLTAALVKILSQLIEHISCIQPDDISKAKVPMADALNTLGAFCEAFLAMVKKATADQKQQLAIAISQMNKLDDGLKEEIQRVASNNENTTKTNYVAVLKKIIKLFVA